MKALFGFEYDDLWKAIIRPPRFEYEDEDLGCKEFVINDNFRGVRTDFELRNQRRFKIKCSFWEPRVRVCDRLPCVIYLHGNSSSRVEAVQEVQHLLPMNVCLFAFDFCACGKSEGDFISLGWYEIQDVACVVEYLRSTVNFHLL